MASSTEDGDSGEFEQEIRLVKSEDWWVATDIQTGVASQGDTRANALANLDEAVALHRGEIGEPIETSEEELEILSNLGLDPDEIQDARKQNDELPEFMS